VRGRSISSTKVKVLPEWLGRCKLLETLCVRARSPAASRVRGGAGAALLRVRCCACADMRWGRSRPSAAAVVARRQAGFTELAALPAAADWPNLKEL
jgi:hypothetical protein